MTHGAQNYFDERAAFEARLAAITLFVSIASLAMLILFAAAPLRRAINDPSTFGFEGPEHYERRIELETYLERPGENRSLGLQYVPRAVRGGGSGGRSRHHTDTGRPQSPTGPLGPGDESASLLARTMKSSSSLPLVQSEELIFERLVKPIYPDEARARGIEGRFAILALIDTTGRVVDVQVQSGDPEGLLERQAADAVRACVIRPYRVNGVAHEIVARFPFNFYLQN
jgi:TonB family protein